MKEKIQLPDVTICCIDTINYSLAFAAITKSLEQVTPARTIFFTDITWPVTDELDVVNIKHLFSKKDYSTFMMKELGKYDIKTSHVLIIQYDGYILDGEQWNDEFLKSDFLGALWPEVDGFSNGNGGFSLRSWKLCQALANDEFIIPISPEDVGICRIYRSYLEQKYGIVFGSDKLCQQFSYELIEPQYRTFGHHSRFHPPYKETVVIRRQAALGDVVQLEPVLEYFHKSGFRVVLDTLPQFYALFAFHEYPIEDYQKFNKSIRHRVINLNLSYEMMPQKLHLEAYFLAAGVSNYKLRNPKLKYTGQNRFFSKRYVVIHIDDRDTPERNIVGVDWVRIKHFLENEGFLVIQIGRNASDDAGIRFNTFTEGLMMMLISGADIMIGIDSGPSNIAVAMGIKSVIFFGSVNPKYIYADLSRVIPIQENCPINNQNCWGNTPGSTRGTPCTVDKVDAPPCCLISTEKLIKGIKKAMLL